MGVTVAVTRVAANTTTGTQDITTSDLGGLTPKAAFLMITYGITDGTAASHAGFGIGAATGAANEWLLVMGCEDGLGTTDTAIQSSLARSTGLIEPGNAGNVYSEAAFSSWLTNGMRINWLTNDGNAYLLTVIFFAGSDLSAHANSAALGNSVDLTTDITDPGFEPDIVIACARNASGTHASHSVGFIHNDGAGGITQRCYGYNNENARSTTDVGSGFSETYGLALAVNNDANNVDWNGEFGSFDSSGFSVTTRNNGANNQSVLYLALNFGGAVDSWVGTYSTPTSTGNDSDTGPGFKPQALLFLETLLESATLGSEGSIGVGFIDADDEYTQSFTSEDNLSTSNEQSLSDNQAIALPASSGTLDIEATFVSFDTNGWTLNFSNVAAAAKVFGVLAIEEESAGPNVSESITITETVGSLVTSFVSTSDSVTLSEVANIALAHQIATSDSLTMTEAVELLITSFIDVSDSITLSEVVSLLVTNFIDVSDDVTLAETIELLITSFVSVLDNIALSETVRLTLAHQIATSDSITIAEAIKLLITSFVNISDSVTIDSVIKALVTSFVDVSSNITLAEVINLALSHQVTISDEITISEAIQAILIHLVGVSEDITLSEVIELLVTSFISVSDSITISEAVNLLVQVVGVSQISVLDSITLSEVTNLLLLQFISVSDSITIAEVVNLLLLQLISISDGITLSETTELLLTSFVGVSDNISLSEAVNLLIPELFIGTSDTITIDEAIAVVLAVALLREATYKGMWKGMFKSIQQ